MKKILFILAALVAFACGSDNREGANDSAGSANSEENVEENSGKNISPQLEDSANRFEVDTLSTTQEAGKKREGELDN